MNSRLIRAPLVVLDTNVVFDWLLFRNPECAAIESALVSRQIQWVGTAAMRCELTHVLARGHLDSWNPDSRMLLSAWEQNCIEVPAPIGNPAVYPRCTDSDDQKFIDLAIAYNAQWLLSRDRAILKLARRLRSSGVEVMKPQTWAAPIRAD